jgi:DNA-binding GntR family transcriptional regulator
MTLKSNAAAKPAAPRSIPPRKGIRSAKGGAAGTEPAGPRYLQVARELTAAISTGQYQVGDQLPTELDLCEQFDISRFTAREAVRVLSSAGLVTRRQRTGTVVIATPADARYTHAVSTIGDLHQYAQDTELRLMYVGKVPLAKDRAAQFGAAVGEEWVYAMGMRHESALTGAKEQKMQAGRPLCITRLYLTPELQGVEARLRDRTTAIYAMIEREYGVMIQRVEQYMQGVALDADDAANLGAVPGSPALLIVRRYFDDRGRLLEVAENIHPGERYVYRMQIGK